MRKPAGTPLHRTFKFTRMKKSYIIIVLLLIILFNQEKNVAQSLVCNDLVFISLDETCMHTITPEEILEGTLFDNCIVELDKTAPFGNGPWVAPILGPGDINKTYQVRVKHLPSGNSCWGNVKCEDKLAPQMQCSGLTTVNIVAAMPATLSVADLAITITDGCTPANNIVTYFEGNQTTLLLDCDNVGMNTIKVYATDQAGNSTTCNTTVLVTEDGDCQACVGFCPPAITVTFGEGYNNLRPAFLSNNWSAFDPYGNAAFDPLCTYQDSSYTIQYYTGTLGQSWFLRKWIWADAGGQVTGTCDQPIIFASKQSVTVQGKVYLESTANCTPDPGEPGYDGFNVEATKLPSGVKQIVKPASDGAYSINIELGPLDSAAVINLDLPPGLSSACPSALSIPFNGIDIQTTFDIGLKTDGDCPLMQVNLSALNSRRCSANQFAIKYCNIGFDTAYSAYVTVQFDTMMNVLSATLPYTAGPNNTYTFQLGDVNPLSCGTFYASVFLSCNAVIGQTLCAEATVWPNTPCDGPWAGPFVTATAQCEGDSVSLAIWNEGQQDMTAPLDFIVIEDFIMHHGGMFLLNSGDSITIKVPANGATWRIEADQDPNYPVEGIVSAATEGCGGLNTPGLINAFTLNENPLSTDQECVVVVGSYDPNDKSAVPTGYGNDHTIRANESIEYKIRFQNTGTDTAFRVVIVDTLSTLLDPFTLEAGASSHAYRLQAYAGGIVHFVFDPIILPDSIHNEAASHGFVQFRIAQKPDLPDGTVIENTASIYFDSNDPVLTNTVHHTIGRPYVALKSQTPHVPGVEVSLMPNPFQEQTVVEVQGKAIRNGMLSLYDSQGRLVRRQNMPDNRTILYRQDLKAGLYFFQITEEGATIASGKVQVY